jgi:GntR family transcriptional regulator, transcriptional repressor for pyruvate dehydrogenase complex
MESIKIKKISASDQVIEKMKEFIKTGKWKLYEKIPSENELSQVFGVNRLTVRIAIQKLNTLDVLETQVGEGTFVKKFNFSDYINNATDFFTNSELIDDVYEFRKAVEIPCAKLAILNATQKELEELKVLADNYTEKVIAVNSTPVLDKELFNQLVLADLNFHQKICLISHNSLLAYSFIVARESIIQYLRMIIKERLSAAQKTGKDTFSGSHIEMHMQICNAIVNKDFDTCRKYYLKMIDYNVESI